MKRPPTPAQLSRRAMKHVLAAVRLSRRASDADQSAADLAEASDYLSKGYSMLNLARSKREKNQEAGHVR